MFSRISKDLGPRSVFSRLHFPDHSYAPAKNTEFHHPSPRFHTSLTGIHSGPNQALNLDLNLGSSISNSNPLTGSNCVPLGQYKILSSSHGLSGLGRKNCSRCLSYSHLRPNCTYSVRCNACFRLGHVASSCTSPPRFPGLSMERLSSFAPCAGDWSHFSISRWFHSNPQLPVGPNPLPVLVFSSFALLSHALSKPASAPAFTIPWKDISPATLPCVPPSTSPSSTIPPDHPLHQSTPPSCSDPGLDFSPRSSPSAFPLPSHFHASPAKKTPPLATVNPAPPVKNPDMAFRFVDPTPFIPRGFQRVQIEGCKLMSRVVMEPPGGKEQ